MKRPIFLLTYHLTHFLEIDISYFLRGTFWGVLQQIIGVSSGLFISYLFGHYVTKEVFGEYNLVLSYLSILTFFSLPGIDTALVNSAAKGYDFSLITSFKKKFTSSIFGTLILLALSLIYFLRDSKTVGVTLLFSALLFPFFYSFTNYPAYLTGKRQFQKLAWLAILSSCAFLIIQGVGIVFQSTLSVTLAYILAMAVPSIICFLYTKKQIRTKLVDQNLIRYGTFLTVVSVIPWVSGHLGSIVLAQVSGAEALAVYAVASRFLMSVQKNFFVFYKPITSKLAGQTPKQHWNTIIKHGFKFLAIGGGLAFGLWLVSPLLINFFFTEKYSEAIIYSQWLSLALIPLPITWVLSDILVYQKRKRSQLVTSSIPYILKISLYLLLVPKWGIVALVFILLLERYMLPILSFVILYKSMSKT